VNSQGSTDFSKNYPNSPVVGVQGSLKKAFMNTQTRYASKLSAYEEQQTRSIDFLTTQMKQEPGLPHGESDKNSKTSRPDTQDPTFSSGT